MVAVLAFAATNIDDLFVLVGFFADPAFRARQVVLGQYLGIAALIAASLAGALATLMVPPAYIGLLGVLPIAIGIRKLWRAWRAPGGRDEESHPAAGVHKILAVAMVTIASGGDNIGVSVPMFAHRPALQQAVIVAVFAAMTALWCCGAHYLVNHRALGAPIRRHGHRLLPWILIAIGLVILHENDTLGLIGA